jgi:hypothetical protein
MANGKRKSKAEDDKEDKEDNKKIIKKPRIDWDFFHDKPE